MEKFVPIHMHLLMKASVKNVSVTAEEGKAFLISLVKSIGMVPVTDPQCVVVTFPGNEGPTGSINLATSHIAFHLWEETGLLMLDVYSCKTFDIGTVLSEVNRVFDVTTADLNVVDRMTMQSVFK